MTEGKKFDDDKIQPSIVLGDFSRALIEVCRAGETGIKKYDAGNWLKVSNAPTRYDNALMRHWLDGKIQDVDSESKLLHMAHTAWNALACLELELRRLEKPQLKVSHDSRGLSENMSDEDKRETQLEIRKMLEEKVKELEKEARKGPAKP